MERLENHEIDLNPSYQRKSNLWPPDQQSRLIESLMLKIPIPAFYFNATDDDNWIVIDGLQRLTAFLNYLVGAGEKKEKQKLEGLQYLKDFNGHTFDDLPRQYMRRIKETPVIAYAVEKGTPDEIVFNIFQRINTGGIALNDQEIRQALYQGNIDNYLIKTMKLVNTYDDGKIAQVEENFKRVMSYCADIFGKLAFRKYNEKRRRGPVNKAIFEMWAVCFFNLTENQLNDIVRQKERFLQDFFALQQNNAFILAVKSGDPHSTSRRIKLARNMMEALL